MSELGDLIEDAEARMHEELHKCAQVRADDAQLAREHFAKALAWACLAHAACALRQKKDGP